MLVSCRIKEAYCIYFITLLTLFLLEVSELGTWNQPFNTTATLRAYCKISRDIGVRIIKGRKRGRKIVQFTSCGFRETKPGGPFLLNMTFCPKSGFPEGRLGSRRRGVPLQTLVTCNDRWVYWYCSLLRSKPHAERWQQQFSVSQCRLLYNKFIDLVIWKSKI